MSGVGTELTRLFARAGINHTNDCQCGNNAETLDACGIEWCEYNVPSIVAMLRDEASRRGIPFMEVVARMIVKQAIRNAKRRRQCSPNSKSNYVSTIRPRADRLAERGR